MPRNGDKGKEKCLKNYRRMIFIEKNTEEKR